MNRQARWNGWVIALHWSGAALMLVLMAIGYAMTHSLVDAARAFELFQLHKSLGFLMLALTLIRLAARVLAPAPQACAKGWERALAASTQGATYALTLWAIVAGWLVVSYSPLPIPTRLFGLVVIPNLAAPDPHGFLTARAAHQFAAYAMLPIVALHIAGALKHHFVDRDDLFTRMAPTFRSDRAARRRRG